MSLFYGERDQDNPYPKIQHPSNGPSKSSNEQTFKKKEQYKPRDSVFLEQPEKEPSWFQRCCSCCSLNYYQGYFKVTDNIVKRRIANNLKFWGGGFFKIQPKVDEEKSLKEEKKLQEKQEKTEEEYDLYGPFWLYTTMIFMVGAVHNVLIYENSQKNTFSYDFKSIGVAMSVFYMVGLGLSGLIGQIFKCLGLQCTLMQIICIYGYSMSTYILCVVLCIINMTLMTWLFLLYAAGSKIAFIVKNVNQSLKVPSSKNIMVILIVAIEAAIQLLIIKFAFIKTQSSGSIGAAFSHMQSDVGVLHLRAFSTLM